VLFLGVKWIIFPFGCELKALFIISIIAYTDLMTRFLAFWHFQAVSKGMLI
jgi:hypothetical protein